MEKSKAKVEKRWIILTFSLAFYGKYGIILLYLVNEVVGTQEQS